jgi:pilus assembly protein CpaB
MRARLVLVLVLILSLGGAGLLLYGGPNGAAAPQPKPEHRILVAAAPLLVGTLIRGEDVEWRNWEGELPPHAIEQRPAGPGTRDPLADVTGAVVRRALDRGQPVVSDVIAKPGDRGFLAAVLDPGMRALSVAVNLASGTTGLIYPGDRVDVILTQIFKEGDAPAGRRSAGETVAHNLRVLAIDQQIQPARAEPTLDARGVRTVTLEVTPRQSEQIAVAADLGKLSLTLRSLVSGTDEATGAAAEQKPVWAEDVSTALRANIPAAPGEARGALVIMHGGKTEAEAKAN